MVGSKVCACCKKELGRNWKWLGIPFYKQERAVCLDCYKDFESKLQAKAED